MLLDHKNKNYFLTVPKQYFLLRLRNVVYEPKSAEPEVKFGQGSKARWGRLKSGLGWVALDFVKRV